MDYIQSNKMSKPTYGPAVEFIFRWLPFLGYVLIALMGKFGYDLVSNRKITIKYMAGTSLMALFVGYIVYQWCILHPAVNPGIAIPVATMFSRDLIVFATMIDKKKLFEMLMTGNKKTKE